jgi:hypothetical protein
MRSALKINQLKFNLLIGKSRIKPVSIANDQIFNRPGSIGVKMKDQCSKPQSTMKNRKFYHTGLNFTKPTMFKYSNIDGNTESILNLQQPSNWIDTTSDQYS